MTAAQRRLADAIPNVGDEITWFAAFQTLGLSTGGTANAVLALQQRGLVVCDSYSILRIT